MLYSSLDCIFTWDRLRLMLQDVQKPEHLFPSWVLSSSSAALTYCTLLPPVTQGRLPLWKIGMFFHVTYGRGCWAAILLEIQLFACTAIDYLALNVHDFDLNDVCFHFEQFDSHTHAIMRYNILSSVQFSWGCYICRHSVFVCVCVRVWESARERNLCACMCVLFPRSLYCPMICLTEDEE